MSVTIRNTYGSPHHVSPKNPAHVTSCDLLRVSATGIITPDLPHYDDMVEILKVNGCDTRPGGYGLVFMESEEFCATYFGPPEQIEQYRRDLQNGPATFDPSQGVMYPQWPQGAGWDLLVPQTFWNQAHLGAIGDGIGIITAFAHTEAPGAEVVVYEFEGQWMPGDGKPVKMVTYHCTACHTDTFHDAGHVRENRGPNDRRWIARQAREHILGAHYYGVGGKNSPCQPTGNETLRIVNTVMKERLGSPSGRLPDSIDAYCTAEGPCSIIRELRAGVRPLVYRSR